MIDLSIIVLWLLALPAAFAIHAAVRSGARGWLGYSVWTLEALAAWLRDRAAWLRAYHAFREGMRQ